MEFNYIAHDNQSKSKSMKKIVTRKAVRGWLQLEKNNG